MTVLELLSMNLNKKLILFPKKYIFFKLSIFWYFQVAGPYLQQYDVYYNRLDPDGKNEIPAMAAAGFLKKSGLPDDVLGKVCNDLNYYP